MIAHNEPLSSAQTTPHPEWSALRLLLRYTEVHHCTIKAVHGTWIVTGPGIDEPVEIDQYTPLVAFLARTYGRV